ncbi:HisA/HisF-related TIM barrel protein [Caballeronia mineralivorans]|jgi:phosphoribosylformimino-5-aminoimidazole carboxamide ribotide isomerase|uniref:HisA/HisF-related TIM barrel protein n=1 Tax=Caballeronia mineralivorans TaxID=2010198 RepID=UPI0023EFEC4E|nr:HisA/HisF-related TIM barrel protein [Caballeronia mineralivorans]MDB5781947.1 Phosphoribosylformimino-5-aminoimidazole carboxamide ribotide isomerase [Caballeronia mineralivorans]MEA3104850.1 phosphoribosylformimino-5-aminoimidazole carboxamide ribotide isomerase [Caballeronia mineralivorans]
MQVIPVLDLLDGQAVRAMRGERARYRPIESPLCATSEPLAVARALLGAVGTRTLYIADLGAILKRGDHARLLAELLNGLGEAPVQIWLDAGYVDFPSMRSLFDRIEAIRRGPRRPGRATLVPVFGTETLLNTEALHEAQTAGFAPVLSLDHRAGRLIADPVATRPDTSWWPSRVIVMTLDHVGSYQGPDLDTFAAIRAQAGHRELIGAGGIRHAADLSAAAESGAAAWLVASAIHDRQLDLPSTAKL